MSAIEWHIFFCQFRLPFWKLIWLVKWKNPLLLSMQWYILVDTRTREHGNRRALMPFCSPFPYQPGFSNFKHRYLKGNLPLSPLEPFPCSARYPLPVICHGHSCRLFMFLFIVFCFLLFFVLFSWKAGLVAVFEILCVCCTEKKKKLKWRRDEKGTGIEVFASLLFRRL